MKSVVVEGSTVAKAIESAWLKAEKPEEFFVRVLQEHSSGFLGFGGQKAKVVLFFKNNHKSDSLFPTVLKQKEYTNFFDNKNLKIPTELNLVDAQLNKNAIVSNGQKKKHGQQNHQAKSTVQINGVQGQQKSKPVQPHVQTHAKPVQSQPVKPVVLQKVATHNHPQAHQAKQVKVGQPMQEKAQKSPLQVSLQAPSKQPVQQKKSVQAVDAREDVAHDIAKVLKKVQSQKIVANVSRTPLKALDYGKNSSDKVVDASLEKAPVHKNHGDKAKVVTPKFESYAEFMDAQADKAAAKAQSTFETIEKIEKAIEKVAIVSVDSIISKIESLPVDIVVSKPVAVIHQKSPAVEKQAEEKRPFIKMKRRPLSTDNPGVSGITRSSDKKQVEDSVQQSEHGDAQKNDNE